MQHCPQGFKGSLLQRTLLAGAAQSNVGDPVWLDLKALIKAFKLTILGARAWRSMSAKTSKVRRNS